MMKKLKFMFVCRVENDSSDGLVKANMIGGVGGHGLCRRLVGSSVLSRYPFIVVIVILLT